MFLSKRSPHIAANCWRTFWLILHSLGNSLVQNVWVLFFKPFRWFCPVFFFEKWETVGTLLPYTLLGRHIILKRFGIYKKGIKNESFFENGYGLWKDGVSQKMWVSFFLLKKWATFRFLASSVCSEVSGASKFNSSNSLNRLKLHEVSKQTPL